jgi:hypothetical protein
LWENCTYVTDEDLRLAIQRRRLAESQYLYKSLFDAIRSNKLCASTYNIVAYEDDVPLDAKRQAEGLISRSPEKRAVINNKIEIYLLGKIKDGSFLIDLDVRLKKCYGVYRVVASEPYNGSDKRYFSKNIVVAVKEKFGISNVEKTYLEHNCAKIWSMTNHYREDVIALSKVLEKIKPN